MAEKQIPSDPGIRRTLGRLIGAAIVVAAVVMVIISLLQWQTRPQTDDATVRANFVGIAPQVNGHIVELHVRDNQQVKEGDLLFLSIRDRTRSPCSALGRCWPLPVGKSTA